MSAPTSHNYFSQHLKLSYVAWGAESAPPLLLIHGGRDHARNWDWVAARLASRYRIIAPDLRGHGDSDWALGGGYSEMQFVYDIVQLVQQKQLAPLTVIGHSLGGSIALLYSGLYPETVTKVVAIEGLGPSPAMLARQRETPIAGRVRDSIARRREYAGRVPRRYDSFAACVARMKEENAHLSPAQAEHLTLHGAMQNEDGSWSWKFDPLVRFGGGFGGLSVEEQREIWARIDKPVLLIRGTESWASDPSADGRMAHFQDARLVNLEGAGHWSHHDRFEDFMAAVEEFLAA